MTDTMHRRTIRFRGALLCVFLLLALLASCHGCETLSPAAMNADIVVTPNDSLFIESDMQITCYAGYQFADKSTSKSFSCLIDNSNTKAWSPSVEACQIITCSPLVIQNAMLDSSATVVNTQVVVQCNAGFITNTGLTAYSTTCGSDGQWNPMPQDCFEMMCAEPPTVNHAYSFILNSALKSTALDQVITYRCYSGRKVKSLDTHQMKVMCNASAQWQVIEGETALPEDQYSCAKISSYIGCWQINRESLSSITLSSGAGYTDCRGICMTNDFVYASMQGDQCYCFSIDSFTVFDNDHCNSSCVSTTYFCGSTEMDLWSVYQSPYECVQFHSEPVGSQKMANKDTCLQYCKGQNQKLAFWRAGYRHCYCLNALHNSGWSTANNCDSFTTEVETLVGYIIIVDLNIEVGTSCEDLFNKGIYFHGKYYVSGTIQECIFLDNSTTCEQGWIAYQDSCYYFDTTAQTMSAHVSSCASKGSRLVSVGSKEEHNFLIQARASMSLQKYTFYLGLYDQDNIGNFQPSDETAQPYLRISNYLHNGFQSLTFFEYTHLMRAVNPASSYGAICEKSKYQVGCATGSLNVGNFFENLPDMTTSFCFELCRVELKTFSVVSQTSCYCYDDLSAFDLTNWTNCDVVCPGNSVQLCGGSGGKVFITEDYGQTYRSNCEETLLSGVQLNQVMVKEGTLKDCSTFIGSCRKGWIQMGSQCYRPILHPVKWNNDLICLPIGGHLAVFETDQERQDVKQLVSTVVPTYASSIWLSGLTRQRQANPFGYPFRYVNGAWFNATEYPLTDQAAFHYRRLDKDFYPDDILQDGSTIQNHVCEYGPDFLGCYRTPPLVQPEYTGYYDVTVRQCKETCKVKGSGYIAISSLTGSCYCVEEADLGTVADFQTCTHTCVTQMGCGGTDHVTVYGIDYNSTAVTCAELVDQGVLISGEYKLTTGHTWCGLKDSTSLSQEAFDCSLVSNCTINVLWNKLGQGNETVAQPVSPFLLLSGVDDMRSKCHEIFGSSGIMFTTKTTEMLDLVLDLSKWSIAETSHTYIGATDEYNMGLHTWSDGSLFRSNNLSIESSVPSFTSMDSYKILSADITGTLRLASITENSPSKVACHKDTYSKQCFKSSYIPKSYMTIALYFSMSLTLCRQTCQQWSAHSLFISTTTCICGTEANYNEILSYMVVADMDLDSECSVFCPGNSFQHCGQGLAIGATGYEYFREYITFSDEAQDCQVLYDNFVLLDTAITAPNGSQITCKVDDGSSTCPNGFIAKNGNCYSIQPRQDINFNNIAQTCASLYSDAYVASPLTMTDLYDIINLIDQFTSTKDITLWATGFYSPFKNGRFASATGFLLPDLYDSGKPNLQFDKTTGLFTGVEATTQLPFGCQQNTMYYKCRMLPVGLLGTAAFSMPGGMTVQQCSAYCYTQNAATAALHGDDCYCTSNHIGTLSGSPSTCDVTCSGAITQLCGGSDINTFSLYSVHSVLADGSSSLELKCEELLSYGIVKPATYVTTSTDRTACFKFSPLSDYILARDTSFSVVTFPSNSPFTSAGVQLRIEELEYGGWVGDSSSPSHQISITLSGTYVLEGLVVNDVEGAARVEQVSLYGSFGSFQSQAHPDNPINLPATTTGNPAWVGLSKPMVAQFIWITLVNWTPSATAPGLSLELVGYRYSQHSDSNQYIGCRTMAAGSHSSLSINQFDTCEAHCQDLNEPFLAVHLETGGNAMCQCLNSSAAGELRDFHEIGQCQLSDDTSYKLSNLSSGDLALYRSSDIICNAFELANFTADVTYPYAESPAYVTEGYLVGTIITILCDLGYYFPALPTATGLVRDVNVSCTNFGNIEYLPGQDIPRCEILDCGAPVIPIDTVVTQQPHDYIFNQTFILDCAQEGHFFDGNYNMPQWAMTCEADGTWYPMPLPCSEILCSDDIPFVANSVNDLDYATPNSVGTVVLYYCLGSSVLPSTGLPSGSVKCGANGLWESIDSECIEISGCYNVSTPSVARSTVTLNANHSIAVYRCWTGSEFPDGTTVKTLECLGNDTWPNVDTNCQQKASSGSDVCKISINKCWMSAPFSRLEAPSLISCALSCSKAGTCNSFCYHKEEVQTNSENCLLYNTADTSKQSNVGWDLFEIGSSCF